MQNPLAPVRQRLGSVFSSRNCLPEEALCAGLTLHHLAHLGTTRTHTSQTGKTRDRKAGQLGHSQGGWIMLSQPEPSPPPSGLAPKKPSPIPHPCQPSLITLDALQTWAAHTHTHTHAHGAPAVWCRGSSLTSQIMVWWLHTIITIIHLEMRRGLVA